ncbi:hypothetical protein [Streptomyces sp. NPDC000134]|uniref:hypothetical protein n=1 Tax=Streptomyces sp. NPDC000134 TaxID=3364536 RepID=UPI00367A2309
MRLPARRTATSVLCATFLLGLTGPVAMAADGDAPRERAGAAAHAPGPGAGEPDDRAQVLGAVGDYLRPVTELLGTMTRGDEGRLTSQEADLLNAAVEEALAKAEASRTTSLTTYPDDADEGDADEGDVDQDDDADDDDADENCDADEGWGGFAPGGRPNGPDAAAPVTTLPARPSLAPDDPAADTAVRDRLRSDIDTLVDAGLSGGMRQVDTAVSDLTRSMTDALTAVLSGSAVDDRA